jgi:ribosomal protein S12 methylthiotransferase
VDNAASFPLSDKVDAATITDRRNQVMAIQKKISRENLRVKKGATAIALVEGPSKDNPLVWEARLEGMAPEIDGKVYLTDIEVAGQTAETGDVARVEITKTDNYDLIARVVEILPRSIAPVRSSSTIPAAAHPVEQLTRISTGAALRVLG